MMKSTMKYISAAALMLAMAACSNDENLDSTYTNDPDAVRINATVGEGIPITRSNPIGTVEAQATFNTDDQIAVQAGKQAAVTYQYSGTAWTPAAGQYLKWETASMSFTAYYPVNKNGASMEAFTLPADQSTLEKLADADYMTCAVPSEAKAATVSLLLTRRTARIVISGITFNDQFKEGYTVSDIKVTGNSTGYAGGIVQTGSTIQVTSCKAADSKFYALLTPTTADANATFLTLTVTKTADQSTTTLLVKGIPATEAGKSYDYTLAVGKNLAQVGSVTVQPWTDGTAIPGGEAEEVIPKYTKYNEVGSGTEADPYQIWNKAQLMNFDNAFVKLACDKHIKLMKDIDLTGETWTPIDAVDNGGIIDGNFHTIKGMTMVSNSNRKDQIGFCLNNKETIKNLTIDNATITNNETVTDVGVFAAQNNGKIMNCHVLNGIITAPNAKSIGGLVSNNSGSVIGCSVINTTIVRASYIGGLISTVASSGVMKGCMFCGSLNINSGDEGGIVLAAEQAEANATLTSVYCRNTYTGAYITKTLWGRDVNATVIPTNCAYVDGTTTTWTTAITNMNAAISSDITDCKYEYDATLGCPKMVKK